MSGFPILNGIFIYMTFLLAQLIILTYNKKKIIKIKQIDMKSLYKQYHPNIFARAIFGKTNKSQRKFLWGFLGITLIIGIWIDSII